MLFRSRPLCEDESSSAQAVTRDYTIELDDELDNAPLLSVFGGKLTTYRKLGEAAVEHLAPYFPSIQAGWTKDAVLPGGDFRSRESLHLELIHKYHWLDDNLASRWVSSYGTSAYQMLQGKTSMQEMGKHFGHGLYQAEVDYLTEHEWAVSAEDILWRRTKLGLEFSQAETEQLSLYLNADGKGHCQKDLSASVSA